MKKITFLFLVMFISMNIFAQQLTIPSIHPVASSHAILKAPLLRGIDTLMGPVFYTNHTCADTITYFGMGSSGYLTGNGYLVNGTTHFPLTECSQGFDNTTAGTITGAIATIDKISGTTGTFVAKVYTVDANMKPSTLLGTSNTVTTGSVTSGGANVSFTFATPPAVTGNFAVSIAYPTTAGDTIVVFDTRDSCIDYSKPGYAYVDIPSASMWMQYKTLMGGQSPARGSFDLFIFAILTSSTGIQENPLNAYLNLFPNPASDHVTIASLSKISKVRVMNCLGQTISNEQTNTLLYDVNTSNYEAGMYILQIETEKGTICKKITINR